MKKDQLLPGAVFSVFLESSVPRLLITSSLIAEMDGCMYLDVLSLEASVSGCIVRVTTATSDWSKFETELLND